MSFFSRYCIAFCPDGACNCAARVAAMHDAHPVNPASPVARWNCTTCGVERKWWGRPCGCDRREQERFERWPLPALNEARAKRAMEAA